MNEEYPYNPYDLEERKEKEEGIEDYKQKKAEKENGKRALFYKLGGFLFLLFALVVMGVLLPKEKEPNLIKDRNTEEEVVEEKKPEVSFGNVDFKAQSVFVYDISKGEVIFEKNSNAQLPLASVTKLMLAYVASDLLPKDELIAITMEDIQKEGDSGFFIDEEWFFEDLLEYTLVSSSNDGASAIAGVANALLQEERDASLRKDEEGGLVDKTFFVKKMNEKAKELDLTQTFFLNSTGLDTNGYISGGYGSARDIAYLLSDIIEERPWVLEATTKSKIKKYSKEEYHLAQNTNTITSDIPCLIGSKTGFTDLAGGNLVIAFDAGVGRPIAAVVLGSTYEGRFQDMEKIVETVLESGYLH